MKQDFQSTSNTHHLDFKIKCCFPHDTASQDLDVGTCSFGERHRSELGTLQQTCPRTPADCVTAHSCHLPALPSRGARGLGQAAPLSSRPPARTPGNGHRGFSFSSRHRRLQAPSRCPSYQPPVPPAERQGPSQSSDARDKRSHAQRDSARLTLQGQMEAGTDMPGEPSQTKGLSQMKGGLSALPLSTREL